MTRNVRTEPVNDEVPRAVPMPDVDPERRVQWSDGLCADPAGHADWVRSVVFSPDGATLAGAGDKTVRTWDARTGAATRRLPASCGGVVVAYE